MRRAALGGVLAACALSGGCGVIASGSGTAPAPAHASASASARRSAPGHPTSPVAAAQATHEYPSGRPPAERVAAGFRSPVDAIDAFATAYINWTAQTVSRQMRNLAAISVAQARSVAQLAAVQTAGDYELRRGGITNSGQVEAVAPLRGHVDEFAVVTRELTTATATSAYQGLKPAWHVAIATVASVAPDTWVVSAWQPES